MLCGKTKNTNFAVAIIILIIGVMAIVAGDIGTVREQPKPMGVWITDVQVGDNPGITYYPSSDGGWVTTPTGLMRGSGNSNIEVPEPSRSLNPYNPLIQPGRYTNYQLANPDAIPMSEQQAQSQIPTNKVNLF
jgi:hypothetical protein